jgi:hypothetical protein
LAKWHKTALNWQDPLSQSDVRGREKTSNDIKVTMIGLSDIAGAIGVTAMLRNIVQFIQDEANSISTFDQTPAFNCD